MSSFDVIIDFIIIERVIGHIVGFLLRKKFSTDCFTIKLNTFSCNKAIDPFNHLPSTLTPSFPVFSISGLTKIRRKFKYLENVYKKSVSIPQS
jgi:hypothetical protein